MTKKMNVLVTGSAGVIGRAVCRELAGRGHAVRGFDLGPSPELADGRVGSVADRPTVDAAMAGIEAVVHLAATPHDYDFMSDLLPNNIVGTYHIMDSAQQHGVRRLVFASTMQVISKVTPADGRCVRVADGVGPANLYAATKVCGEALGQVYAQHDMSVIAVRIGWLPRSAAEAQSAAGSRHVRSVYLSHADAGRFFACAIAATGIKFAVVFATSRPDGESVLDPEPARRLLSFDPVDRYPEGLPWPMAVT